MEMRHLPYWLTSQAVDGLVRERLTLFDEIYREFLDIYACEEVLLLPMISVKAPELKLGNSL